MKVKGMPQPASTLRARLITMYGFLLVLNVGGWAWALIAFHANPVLLGVALLIYGLGLRHAVDADHIAAIDNVTRKLMQAGCCRLLLCGGALRARHFSDGTNCRDGYATWSISKF